MAGLAWRMSMMESMLTLVIRRSGGAACISQRWNISAELSDILSTYGLEAPDVIVSGIPFSTMPCTVGSQILETVASLLAPNGRFVAYQVKRQVATLCEPYMGVGQTTTELLNIPPMRVFKWIKDVKDAA